MTDTKKIEYKLRPLDQLGIEKIDDDLLILDKRNQKIHQLNPTARAIWERLQDGREPDGIVRHIVERFDISPEVALKDVIRVLQQFCALNLLENNTA